MNFYQIRTYESIVTFAHYSEDIEQVKLEYSEMFHVDILHIQKVEIKNFEIIEVRKNPNH